MSQQKEIVEKRVKETNQMATGRPFGWRDKFGYLFGDFGNDFFFILVSAFLMVAY